MNNRNDTSQNKGDYRIDEMFREIYETETISMADGSELLQEGLTEEEKARILSIALRKMDQEAPVQIAPPVIAPAGPVRRKNRRILIAALVAVCAFAGTAFAAEVFQWDARLSNYFGIEEEDGAALSGSGMNVGVGAENGGVTIEAVQTIGDGNNMYILLDVTAPEGQKLDPQSSFEMIYLRVDGATSMGYSCNIIEDDNPDDNRATFLFAMEANKKINDKSISIEFVNLRHYVPDIGEMVIDQEGSWKLEWKLNYEDKAIAFPIGKELLIEGESVEVDSISISPIALNIEIRGDYIEESDAAPREPGEGDLIQITAINLKDGTVLTEQDAASWGCSIRGKEMILNMQMQKLLDVDQIKSVTLNDTEFELQ